jgi:hypothetical protein
MIRAYRRWLLKRRIRKAQRLLILVDRGIKKIGMPRYKRKQLWRDFAAMKADHAEIFDLIQVR